MHVRELFELGAILACHGGLFLRRAGAPRPKTVEQYWVASRCRLGRWTQALQEYQQAPPDPLGGDRQASQWQSMRTVVEEILGSELLVRVWTGLACGWDQRRQQAVFEPLVRSVFQGQLEARNRALNLMVYGRGFDMNEAVSLNAFRRRVERWTDMLLGYLMAEHDVREFAFDPRRLGDFAEDLHAGDRGGLGDPARHVVLAALRTGFQSGLHRHSPNAELNRRIAGSVLSCLDEEMFHATGLLRSRWVERLSCATSEAEGMIHDLLALESPARQPPGGPRRRF